MEKHDDEAKAEAGNARPELDREADDLSVSLTGSSVEIDEKRHHREHEHEPGSSEEKKVRPASGALDDEAASSYSTDSSHSTEQGEADLDHEEIEESVPGRDLDRQLSRVGHSPGHPYISNKKTGGTCTDGEILALTNYPLVCFRSAISKACGGSSRAAASSPRSRASSPPSRAAAATRTARASGATRCRRRTSTRASWAGTARTTRRCRSTSSPFASGCWSASCRPSRWSRLLPRLSCPPESHRSWSSLARRSRSWGP